MSNGFAQLRWRMSPADVAGAYPQMRVSEGYEGTNPRTGEPVRVRPGATIRGIEVVCGIRLNANLSFESDQLVEIELYHHVLDDTPFLPAVTEIARQLGFTLQQLPERASWVVDGTCIEVASEDDAFFKFVLSHA
ncbi:MAG: hypothetical protein M4D80_21280 [Myxococcota bacterium]|nr:hypothetical protein [Myxococcota bacterium]